MFRPIVSWFQRITAEIQMVSPCPGATALTQGSDGSTVKFPCAMASASFSVLLQFLNCIPFCGLVLKDPWHCQMIRVTARRLCQAWSTVEPETPPDWGIPARGGVPQFPIITTTQTSQVRVVSAQPFVFRGILPWENFNSKNILCSRELLQESGLGPGPVVLHYQPSCLLRLLQCTHL